MDKSVAEITVRELIEIIKKQTDPIDARVTKLNETVTPLVKQVKILEQDLQHKAEKIDTLTSIIINMQRSLNMIDFEERATNVMVSGLSETDIVIDGTAGGDDVILSTDEDKVKHILDAIDARIPDADIQECSRIGRPKQDFPRMLKVKVRTKDQRKVITEKASTLKTKPHLKTIYLKKDTHPVYVQETGRLRVKMKKLKEIPGNAEKVKIVDGNLEVDGKIVDKNTFFV